MHKNTNQSLPIGTSISPKTRATFRRATGTSIGSFTLGEPTVKARATLTNQATCWIVFGLSALLAGWVVPLFAAPAARETVPPRFSASGKLEIEGIDSFLGLSFDHRTIANKFPQDPEPTPETSQPDQPLTEREKLEIELQEKFWKQEDRSGRIRKEFPELTKRVTTATTEWLDELTEDELKLMLSSEKSRDEAKKSRDLEKTYRKAAGVLVDQFLTAQKLARKVLDSHWRGMASVTVDRDRFPEYTEELEKTVFEWFHDRTIEDLEIFEKPRPTANERDRGDKITAELLNEIESIQQKHESKWQID